MVSSVNFWGTRILTFKHSDRSESIALDALTTKVQGAGRARQDLTTKERIAGGVSLVNKLTSLYKNTDLSIRHANFFTRLLVWIREFSWTPVLIASPFELKRMKRRGDFSCLKAPFLEFNVDEFKKAFGDHPGKIYEHPACNGTIYFGKDNIRLIAKEENLLKVQVGQIG